MRNGLTVAMIVVSTVVFVSLGTAPANLLIIAGTVNGLILPIGFTVILVAAIFRRRDLLHGYRYPVWLIAVGVVVWALTLWLGANAVQSLGKLWG